MGTGHENGSAFLNLMNNVNVFFAEGRDGVFHTEGDRLFPRLLKKMNETPEKIGETQMISKTQTLTKDPKVVMEIEQKLIQEVKSLYSDADLSKGNHVVTIRIPSTQNEVLTGEVPYNDINIAIVDGKIMAITLASGEPGLPRFTTDSEGNLVRADSGYARTNDGFYKDAFVPVAQNNSRAGGLLRQIGHVDATLDNNNNGVYGDEGDTQIAAVGHHIHEGGTRNPVGNWSAGCTVNNLSRVVVVERSSGFLGLWGGETVVKRIDYTDAVNRNNANRAQWRDRPMWMGAETKFNNVFAGQRSVSQTVITINPKSTENMRYLYNVLYGVVK